jgi:hypothetical protein
MPMLSDDWRWPEGVQCSDLGYEFEGEPGDTETSPDGDNYMHDEFFSTLSDGAAYTGNVTIRTDQNFYLNLSRPADTNPANRVKPNPAACIKGDDYLYFNKTTGVLEMNGQIEINGNLTFRLKYAFMQINLDDWLPKGSWVRFGIQQTPYIDFTEGVYRYRWQGTVFFEREGLQSSADAGVSFHAAFPAIQAVTDGSVIVVKQMDRLWAIDEETFQVIWQAEPPLETRRAADAIRGRTVQNLNQFQHVLDAAFLFTCWNAVEVGVHVQVLPAR